VKAVPVGMACYPCTVTLSTIFAPELPSFDQYLSNYHPCLLFWAVGLGLRMSEDGSLWLG